MMGIGCGTSNLQRESHSENYWEIQKLRQEASSAGAGTDALRDLGVLYLRSGKFQAANQALTRSLTQDRSDPKRWLYTGMSLELMDRTDQALSTYERFLSLTSSSIYTQAMRGRVGWIRARTDREYLISRFEQNDIPAGDGLSVNTYAVFPLECGPVLQSDVSIGIGLSEIISRDIEQLRNVSVIEPRTIRLADDITGSLQRRPEMTRPEWIGRVLGAGKIVGGSCRIDAEQIDIDLIVQDLTTGDTILVSGTAGLADISTLEKQLVRDFAEQLRIWIPEREGADPNRVPEINSILAYSAGLALEDGLSIEESVFEFDRALSIDPSFTLASQQRQYAANMALAKIEGKQDFVKLLVHLESLESLPYLLNSSVTGLIRSLDNGVIPSPDSRVQPPENVGELPVPPRPVRN